MQDRAAPRRRYHSPRRRAQAQATRQAVLEAARELFIERGYVATTIDAIAARASVAPETVYGAFGSKRTLLSELVDIAIAGGAEQPPILDQAWVMELRDEPDARRRVALLARNGRAILERRAAMDAVISGAAAADPDIAKLAAQGRRERLLGQRRLLRVLLHGASLRAGMDPGTAADVLYAIGSPETYRLLVVDRGWSGARFERWYGETLARLLLEPPSQIPG
jgi:TetR/AcrR family transcriptional regulator, regulator of autoinduction and epiphytic fitness